MGHLTVVGEGADTDLLLSRARTLVDSTSFEGSSAGVDRTG
jgi:hypothetical protein